MNIKPDFLTLSKPAAIEYVVQKSRFIGAASPVFTEEEALSHIRRQRSDYKAASHYCYAYIIGDNAGIMRYQDDGEPGGTAGMPILEALRHQKIVNACVVVTRYFGGILLGAGGLTRAYSHTASEAIKAAGLALVEQSIRLTVLAGYPHWDKLEYLLSQRPVMQVEKEFSTQVLVSMVVRQKEAPALAREMMDITMGTANVEFSNPFPWQWPVADESLNL
ncbi:MAG: IMPACT family protein [Eubacteriales bacterium]|nr:IMPACT family protein [Eubacteriales bacterium]